MWTLFDKQNNPASFEEQPANGIPCKTWLGKSQDNELELLKPILISLSFSADPRVEMNTFISNNRLDFEEASKVLKIKSEAPKQTIEANSPARQDRKYSKVESIMNSPQVERRYGREEFKQYEPLYKESSKYEPTKDYEKLINDQESVNYSKQYGFSRKTKEQGEEKTNKVETYSWYKGQETGYKVRKEESFALMTDRPDDSQSRMNKSYLNKSYETLPVNRIAPQERLTIKPEREEKTTYLLPTYIGLQEREGDKNVYERSKYLLPNYMGLEPREGTQNYEHHEPKEVKSFDELKKRYEPYYTRLEGIKQGATEKSFYVNKYSRVRDDRLNLSQSRNLNNTFDLLNTSQNRSLLSSKEGKNRTGYRSNLVR